MVSISWVLLDRLFQQIANKQQIKLGGDFF